MPWSLWKLPSPAIGYIAQALVLGFFVTAGFLLPGSEPERLRRTLAIRACRFLIVFLCVSVGALLIQGAKLQRGELPSLEILWRYLTATQSGNVWLIRAGYAIALALLGFSITRRRRTVARHPLARSVITAVDRQPQPDQPRYRRQNPHFVGHWCRRCTSYCHRLMGGWIGRCPYHSESKPQPS